jgi:acetylornithine deacetylase/succinyl-diaminopimelate desuccinylase-like protein
MRSRLPLVLGALALTAALRAQSPSLRPAIDAWVDAHQAGIVGELVDLVAIPNIASDGPNIARNVEALRGLLARHGFAVETLPTSGNPLVYGELAVPRATSTLLVYAHYDGQPVDAATWRQADPFSAVLRDGRLEDGGREVPGPVVRARYEPGWRLYARSSSDDKSPIVALCAALDALKAAGRAPAANLHVVLDGEEEAGSPSLIGAISRYRSKLAADAIVILDGPVHPGGRPTVTFGARGILTLELTVFGPKFALHSGHYGNWAPNPAFALARLLASMKDDRGRVLVPGFYDGLEPLAPEEREMLAAVPDDEAALRRLFGIAEPEQPGLSLQEAVQRPSLNVRGLSSAFVGAGARTIIPDRATAAIDIRLVKETPSAAMLARLEAHIRQQGFFLVDRDPDDAVRAAHPRIARLKVEGGETNAYRTSPLAPASREIVAAVTAMFGQPPVRIRTMGGTVPIAPFIEAMGAPAIGVPIVNFDNNQHGENENLRLGTFFDGITTLAAVLSARVPGRPAGASRPGDAPPGQRSAAGSSTAATASISTR